jgi:serine/threonine protein kinase
MSPPRDCPAIDSWEALLDDAVPPDQRARHERHLESCSACQARLDRGEDCAGALRRLGWRDGDPTVAPTEPALVRVLERLHEGKPRSTAPGAGPADLSFLRPADRPGVLGTLGGYEVREVIGQGGMGVVLKAFDPALDRLVALKVLASAPASSATARRRFIREAQAAAAVRHDHIVTVHGVHETDGLPYLVMRYVAGGSLQDRLDRGGPPAWAEVVRIGQEAASGLAAAHARGLIHRDIKPANLLLEGEPGGTATAGRVKITDFGLARLVGDVGLTRSGVVAGTPEYMAPEQGRGEKVDHRADLFSLGSVLYALCTGRPPFRADAPLAVLRQVTDETPPPIRSLNPDVPAWLEALVARLMAKDPAERFQSAAEVAGLLEGYLAHLRSPAAVPEPVLPPQGGGGSARFVVPPSGGLRAPDPLKAVLRTRGLRILALVAAAALATLGLWHLLAVPNPPATDQSRQTEFYQDFRGDTPFSPLLSWTGQEGEEVIERQDQGVRVQLTTRRTKKDPVGLVLTCPFKGDFEITAGYELLQADQPRSGMGVGFDLYLMTQSSAREALGLCRVKRADGTDRYICSRMIDQGAQRQFLPRYVLAGGRRAADPPRPVSPSGQLRITRTGTVVTFFAAEGAAGEFRELHSLSIGPEALKTVRVAAFPGNAVEPVDVRFVDLRVRANGVEAAPAANAAPAPAGRKSWLVPGLIVGGAAAALCLVCLWLAGRGRRRGGNEAPLPADGGQAQPDPAGGRIPVTCPGCGKDLKARPELAGKKAKCPKCGQAVPVPVPAATATAVTPPPSRGARRWLVLAASGAFLAAAVAAAFWGFGGSHPEEPTSPPLDQAFGAQPVAEIEDDGFHGPEVSASSGVAYRWTNGAARLTIPLHGPRPKAVDVQVVLPGLPGYRLCIQANHQFLFEDRLSQGGVWGRTFDLSAVPLDRQLVLEILSDTFVPAQRNPGSNDQRVLGVRLVSITLLSGNRSLVDVPFGGQQLPEVAEAGFYQDDSTTPRPSRWTDGAARLTVPVRGAAPRALALTLEIPNLPEYQVALTVNGKKLLDQRFQVDSQAGRILGRDWSTELPLAGVDLGESATIELDSSTFVPAEVLANSGDQRKLGVRVKRLVLISDAAAGPKR